MTVQAALPARTDSVGPQRGSGRRFSILAILGGAWLVLVLISGVFASVLAPYGETEQDLWATLQGPSLAHPLGTDTIGRDVLSRLMYGAPETLIGVGLAIGMFILLGVTSGLLSGYFAGWTDRVVSAGVQIVISTPVVIILFVVLSVFRGNTYVAMLVFGALSSPVMALVVRSATLSLRRELFVDAAKASGLSDLRIVFSHVLPRVGSLVVVQAAVFGANAVVIESALSFLGFGKQPPEATWGNMVTEAATTISLNAWIIYPTGGVIALTALALGLVGESIRDRVSGGWTSSYLTPRSRRGTRRAEATRESDAATDRAPARTPALLEVRDLSVGYRSGDHVTAVVTSVSFDVERGTVVGLVGESGSGKTTVALTVLGSVGSTIEVTGGSVSFAGDDLISMISAHHQTYRGSRIAYVAQEPMVALDPNHRIGDLLTEIIRIHWDQAERPTAAAVRSRAKQLLDDVEIPAVDKVFSMYPHQLSGGMAQRVSIACALAGEPELLVADEPTTALDVTVQAAILSLLHKLKRQRNMALLLITHDWGVVADVCDHVAVLHHGEIVEQGVVEQIFNEPSHPYTRALLAADPYGARPGEYLPVSDSDPTLESGDHPSTEEKP